MVNTVSDESVPEAGLASVCGLLIPHPLARAIEWPARGSPFELSAYRKRDRGKACRRGAAIECTMRCLFPAGHGYRLSKRRADVHLTTFPLAWTAAP